MSTMTVFQMSKSRSSLHYLERLEMFLILLSNVKKNDHQIYPMEAQTISDIDNSITEPCCAFCV